MRDITESAFQAHRILLNLLMSLKNLGHIIMSLDDDWPELVGNLDNVRKIWVRFSILLRREGGETKGVGDVLQGGGTGSNYFWVGAVGDDPPTGTGHLGGSTQGSYMYHWELTPAVSGRKLVVTIFGVGYAGGRV